MKRSIRFVLNGHAVEVLVDDDRTLLWFLRTDLSLTGTKYGCGEGLCGACTVLAGDKAVRACMTSLKSIEGNEITTIEGLARDGKLHPLQQAFIDHGAVQCGYCTPGMLMDAYAFLRKHPKPTHQEIMTHMNSNLCRCGAHQRIISAIEAASRQMSGTT
jgi:nicotinate dehydrogenase subunit A